METSRAHAAAQAGAQWWAEQLADPTFRTTSPEEDLAEPPGTFMSAVMTRGLLHVLAQQHPVTTEQLEAFVEALVPLVLASFDEDGRSRGLHVDYHPSLALAAAAQAADVDRSRFPLKTHMWFNSDGTVTARLGYGGREQLIWAAADWDRPQCSEMRKERRPSGQLRDFEYFPELCARPMYHDGGCGDWVPDTAACRCGVTQADHYNDDDGTRFNHCFEAAPEGDTA